jgi:hypothetical protein
MAKAWFDFSAGKTPVGRRTARMVMATSAGPCRRVSQGRVPVSAKATSAAQPAWRRACIMATLPKVPGGRKITCPSARCGARARAMSSWAKAGVGIRINSAPRTAAPRSAVTMAISTSRRPAMSFSISLRVVASSPKAAASRRQKRTSWPEVGKIGGGGVRAVAAAQHGYAHGAAPKSPSRSPHAPTLIPPPASSSAARSR